MRTLLTLLTIVTCVTVSMLLSSCSSGTATSKTNNNENLATRMITVHVIVNSTAGFSKDINPTFGFKLPSTPITMIDGYSRRIVADVGNDHRAHFDVQITTPTILYSGEAAYQPIIFEDFNNDSIWELDGVGEHGRTSDSPCSPTVLWFEEGSNAVTPSHWQVNNDYHSLKPVEADNCTIEFKNSL